MNPKLFEAGVRWVSEIADSGRRVHVVDSRSRSAAFRLRQRPWVQASVSYVCFLVPGS